MESYSLEGDLINKYKNVIEVTSIKPKWKVNIYGLDCYFEYVNSNDSILISTRFDKNYAQYELPIKEIYIAKKYNLDYLQIMYDKLIQYLDNSTNID